MTSQEQSLSPSARSALQVAFAVFHEQGEWPSYQYLDHELDRAGEDAVAALAGIPVSLAHFDRVTPRLSAITLTVTGICAVDGSESEQALFMRLLEWCVRREREFSPASATGPAEPIEVDAAEFAEETSGPPLDEVDQRKALSFIRTEDFASSSGGPQPGPLVWTATLDPRLRRYRGIETIADYLAAKAEWRPRSVSAASAAAEPASVAAPTPRLGRGERVTIVKAAAQRLSRMIDTDRELTLGAFDVTAVYEGDETIYGFAVRALSGAEEQNLLELAAYLEESDSEAEAPTEPEPEASGPWEPDSFRLFLSHTHPFAGRMSELKAELAGLGISAFVAHADIAPSEAWEEVIESALRSCDALVAFLSEDFPASRWTDQEVGWVAGRRRPVVAIDHGSTPYGFIAKWQSVKSSRPDLVDALVGVLAGHEGSARRMAEVQVALLERAGSAAEGQARMELLERVGRVGWSEALLGRVGTAVADNPALAGAAIGEIPLPQIAADLIGKRRTQGR
ncbi:MAG: toll/interleukin-1 receptor domain-containing protein [Actinobacteria bacterium]|nr:toll/interleukin-1 receptor domain-containing protein [Actinomycetota bacterium]